MWANVSNCNVDKSVLSMDIYAFGREEVPYYQGRAAEELVN